MSNKSVWRVVGSRKNDIGYVHNSFEMSGIFFAYFFLKVIGSLFWLNHLMYDSMK